MLSNTQCIEDWRFWLVPASGLGLQKNLVLGPRLSQIIWFEYSENETWLNQMNQLILFTHLDTCYACTNEAILHKWTGWTKWIGKFVSFGSTQPAAKWTKWSKWPTGSRIDELLGYTVLEPRLILVAANQLQALVSILCCQATGFESGTFPVILMHSQH